MRVTRSLKLQVRPGAERRRTGFTMAETLVVLVLLAIVGVSLTSVLSKQQAFYQGTSDIIALRTQLRQAEAVIGNDLRGISSVGGDITAMTDSSIDYYYTIGASVACVKPSGTTIIIPPTGALTNGNVLTSWLSTPGANDTAWVFDEGPSVTATTDDAWDPFTVTAVQSGVGACDGVYNSPTAGTTVTVGSTVSTYINEGAPVRFVRHAHYSLYQAGDGQWYLGYCSPACDPSSNPISQVAGPFLPYTVSTSPDTSGIHFTYADSSGNATSTPGQVALISIVVRGRTSSYIHIQGMGKGFKTDSVRMNVALRNRS